MELPLNRFRNGLMRPFAGVSAIEISLMEHELMNSDAGVTFEDVMELCDVHANLFKNAVQGSK